MSVNHETAVVIGASSDIGYALCQDWLQKKWKLLGTYRTNSGSLNELKHSLSLLVNCDFGDGDSIINASNQLAGGLDFWDVLVFCPGLQEPIGAFEDIDFDAWEKSIAINFTNQLKMLKHLLPKRNVLTESGPTVIFFAGGGVNNAPTLYSAYTAAKIALIKMVELLAAEIPEVKFVIIGPGWVKTKIHSSVLSAGKLAGYAYERAEKKFKDGTFVPMSRVVACCNALIAGPRAVLSGRNFSVEFDRWDQPDFIAPMIEDDNFYKLRRYGNDI